MQDDLGATNQRQTAVFAMHCAADSRLSFALARSYIEQTCRDASFFTVAQH